MSRKEFIDIIGIDKNRVGFVLGLGPSLNNNKALLKSVDSLKGDYKIISCNNMDMMSDINYDYWMLAQPAEHDSPSCLKNMYTRVNRKGSFFLYTDCLDLTARDWVESHLDVDYIGYDQRHHRSEPCGWGNLPGGRAICCQHIIEGRLCIQEELANVTGNTELYGAGDTVGVHMVALAVMLGLNPIYITGIDIDYSNGYFNNNVKFEQDRIKQGMANMNNVPTLIGRILSDLRIIKESAEKIGTSIYDLDGDGRISSVFEHKRPLLEN